MAPLLDSTRDFRNQPLSLPDSPKKISRGGNTSSWQGQHYPDNDAPSACRCRRPQQRASKSGGHALGQAGSVPVAHTVHHFKGTRGNQTWSSQLMQRASAKTQRPVLMEATQKARITVLPNVMKDVFEKQPTPCWTVKVKTPQEIGTQTRMPVLPRASRHHPRSSRST